MRKITLLLLSMLSVVLCDAAYDSTPDSTPREPIPVTLNGKPVKQPRGVGELPVIDCYYYDGKLYIDTADYIENAKVSVTNTLTGELYAAYDVDIYYSYALNTSYTEGIYYVEIEFDSTILYGYYSI